MKTSIRIILLLLCVINAYSQSHLSALIPRPNSIVQETGKPFKVDIHKTSIYINHPDLTFSAQTLQQIFKEQMQTDVLPRHIVCLRKQCFPNRNWHSN